MSTPADLKSDESSTTAVATSGQTANGSGLQKRVSNEPASFEKDAATATNEGHTSTTNAPHRQNTGASARSTRTQRSESGSAFRHLKRKTTWAALMNPKHSLENQPSYAQSIRSIVTATWLNVLLVFVPVSWVLHFAKVGGDTPAFVTSMLAIIPLAKLLGEGTEEMALRVGDTLGGLLNATLGNATELIIAVLALIKCELVVVQSSLLGSILSNLLLVLGMCFFAGGLRFSEQAFSLTAAQLNSSLLSMSVIAVLIPAGFHAAFSNLDDSTEGKDVLKMSRGIAVILLFVYAAYLVFQLYTHAHLYSEGDTAVHQGHDTWGGHKLMRPAKSISGFKNVTIKAPDDAEATSPTDGSELAEEDDEAETPKMNTTMALILLVTTTVLIGVTSECLVDSIQGITKTGAISEQWVGLILLPIVGNAAEHVTAVTTGYKDKLDISIGVAVGSSIQIALFVIPLLVLLGWALGKPLTMLFDPFESIILFLAVLIANYTTQDAKANWLEGWLLMMTYVIIAVAFFFYPAEAANQTLGLTC